MTYKHYILIALLFLIFTGCQNQNEAELSTDMQLSLCLPIQEHVAPKQNRVMGDPGTTEQFELPRYVYIIVLKQEGETWSVWRKEERTLKDADWKRTRYYGLNTTRGDSIYRYDEKIQYLLIGDRIKGRVFAICSNKRLTFNSSIASISDLDDVLAWKFSTAPDSIQENLHNIYSTPYNYERNGKYYCSFDCSTGTLYSVDLLMYHIASKVDITWNVDETKRINRTDPTQAVRLTRMDAVNLFNGDAFCFKPMENTVPTLPASGKSIQMVTPTDEGLWWEGRSYFYTIPYTVEGTPGYFPLQMIMQTNDSGDDYKPTLNLSIDTSSPFVPWLRANFMLSKPLAEGEPEAQYVNEN